MFWSTILAAWYSQHSGTTAAAPHNTSLGVLYSPPHHHVHNNTVSDLIHQAAQHCFTEARTLE